MPYKTKADRKRAEWVTLPEDTCDERVARDQLIAALSDGVSVLGPLKWEREPKDRPPPFGTTSITRPTDTPPLGAVWSKAKINWKTGRVRDEWGEYKRNKWRVLLILRHNVLRQLPQPGSTDRSKAGGPSANIIEPPTRNVRGRPTPRDQVYDELQQMQTEGCNMTRPQKALAEEVAKRQNKKLGDRNWSERAIIEHISDWLHKKGLA
jgi:hypothetical protein